MDRVYDKYIKSKTISDIGMNTLLYSRIKSIKNVYADPDGGQYIYFETDSNKTCIQFQMLLVYVSILSSKQVHSENLKRNKNSPQYISLHSSMDMAALYSSGRIYNSDYDMYDFSIIEQSGIGKSFYKQPIGYGQYMVKQTTAIGGRERGLYKRCDLQRNKNWCTFPGEDQKSIGGSEFKHSSYSNKNDEIRIDLTYDSKNINMIHSVDAKDLDVAYNIPLSANAFPDDNELSNISKSLNKRKMQISHYLYGLYFGSSLKNTTLYKGVRDFFSLFANRPRIENIIKYLTGETDYSTFDAGIRASTTLVSDLQLQSLYYPFYTGGNRITESEIGRYFKTLEEADQFVQDYISELGGDDLKEYYLGLNLLRRQEFYNNYVGGTELPPDIRDKMMDVFNRVKNHIMVNNEVKIEIAYKSNDITGKTIAIHIGETLHDFFSGLQIKNNITTSEIDDYSEAWSRRVENNLKESKLSLLIKGWNYKFDMINELKNQYIDDSVISAIEAPYRMLIDGTSALSAETVYYRVARQFVDNTVMVPLLAIQNYAIYRKGDFPAFDTNQDIEILLLPYYWESQ
jgi:ribosomal protein L31